MDSFRMKEVTLVWPISNTDGNILFDAICVTENIPLVERYIKGHVWYKHFYPTMEVDNLLREDNILIITFMISPLKSDGRAVLVKVFFDFRSKVMKAKHLSSYTISTVELVELISNTIRIDILDEVKCTNIELSAAIIKEKPDLELLCDIIMNESRLGLFSLREKNVPVSMKIKYSIYTKLGVVTFRREENKSVVISNIKKEEHIDGAIEQVLLLLDVYEEVREKFSRLYNVISEEEKASKYRTRTFALKEEVPELFVAGYARECSIKPIIITELEKEKYESEG